MLGGIGFAIIFGVFVVVLYSNKAPIDFVALAGLLALLLTGYLSPAEAFSGFSSATVITMVGVFFLSGALRLTGVADRLGVLIAAHVGPYGEAALVGAVMLVGAGVSAFMNNFAAAALLLPTVMVMSGQCAVPASRLLMPLSFGVVLGGTLSVLGTPANMLMSDILAVQTGVRWPLLATTPIGVGFVLCGALFMARWGRRMLPEVDGGINPRRAKGTLQKLYRLSERLFSLNVPSDWAAAGLTLSNLNLGGALGAQVVAIVRGGRKILSPDAAAVLQRNDRVVMGGRLSDLQNVRSFQDVTSRELRDAEFEKLGREFVWLRCQFGPSWAGRMLSSREVWFDRSLRTLACEHPGSAGLEPISDRSVVPKDIVWAVAGSSDVVAAAADDVTVLEPGAVSAWRENLFVLCLPIGWESPGFQLHVSDIERATGVRPIAVLGELPVTLLSFDDVVHEGSSVVVWGSRETIRRFRELGRLSIESEAIDFDLESDDVALVEVMLTPRSKLIDETLAHAHFRERYDFQALAVWRNGAPIRSRLSRLPLKFGDALLLHGPKAKLGLLERDPDLMVLSNVPREGRRGAKAGISLAALLVMIALSISNLIPVHVASIFAAGLVVLFGAMTMEEGYREVEWRLVFFVGALLPFGIAFERSGAAAVIADNLVAFAGHYGVVGAIVGMAVAASLVSQLVDSVIAVVMLGPVAVVLAQKLGVPPQVLCLAVCLGTSIAFVSPLSAKAHLLVMGAGGYRPRDFFKPGLFVSVLCFVVLVGFLVLSLGN